MTSRPSSPPTQYASLEELYKLLEKSPEQEPVLLELQALESIYLSESIRVWPISLSHPDSGFSKIRFEIITSLQSPHEDVSLHLLITMPPSYPASSAPQLQLLSRYVGAFSVDPGLSGPVLRTYFSSLTGVAWSPGDSAVFDGVEHVRERATNWYQEKLSEKSAGELQRELNKENHTVEPTHDAEQNIPMELAASVELPSGIEFTVAEPITDRKSVFIGRACRITHHEQVPIILAYLMADKRIARAAHPIINAWRCTVDGVLHQDNDDDGESAAGRGLAHLLQIMFSGVKDQNLIKNQAFIGGQWVDAKDGGKIKVNNPATGELLGTVPELGVEDTKKAIQHAAEAFKTWSKTTAKERHDVLRKLYQLMIDNNDDLGLIITLENGKPLAEAKGENAYSASFVDWFAGEAMRTYGGQLFAPKVRSTSNVNLEVIPSPMLSIRNVVVKQPVGVAALLTPWNFPSAMIGRKLAPALAAGCTVVIKPPAETPFSALALTELARRAGVPDGVINVVTTDKNIKDVGRELCESKDVKKVSFTGSTPVAKILSQQASSTLKKVSWEAGGNAPFIVFDDADIEKAVEGAIACKFRGSGQTCVCANRIYVQASVYADFAAQLAEKVDAFKLGNGMDPKTQSKNNLLSIVPEYSTHGPLIHAKAIGKVEAHVKDAVSRGASILVGGKRAESLGPNFFEPTVLADVPTDAQLADEETFGPVAALIKFETEDEVIRLANNSDVGLAGYFFSRDVGRVWRVAEALEVGMVGTNTGLISQAQVPFGGVKESGLGREGGPHGIDEYMNTKLVVFGGL
ncbi:succinate semialdehyde dehydrogenase NADP+ linked [Ceratobasidium sp. 392]|nr:succinate semialdehyde dehydrogenase NADP+ linked [Ceratobasidium sp. 392]